MVPSHILHNLLPYWHDEILLGNGRNDNVSDNKATVEIQKMQNAFSTEQKEPHML